MWLWTYIHSYIYIYVCIYIRMYVYRCVPVRVAEHSLLARPAGARHRSNCGRDLSRWQRFFLTNDAAAYCKGCWVSFCLAFFSLKFGRCLRSHGTQMTLFITSRHAVLSQTAPSSLYSSFFCQLRHASLTCSRATQSALLLSQFGRASHCGGPSELQSHAFSTKPLRLHAAC